MLPFSPGGGGGVGTGEEIFYLAERLLACQGWHKYVKSKMLVSGYAEYVAEIV
jgi:hypothetical protein